MSMKNYRWLVFLPFCVQFVFAQEKNNPVDLPPELLTAIQKQFPKVSPSAIKKTPEYNYEFHVGDKGSSMLVCFDPFGNLLFKEKKVKREAFPSAALRFLAEQYPGQEFNNFLWADWGGEELFIAQAAKNTYRYLFDKEGNFLRMLTE